MHEDVEQRAAGTREPGLALLSFALFGGLTAWTVHLVALAALVAPACTHGLSWVQNVVTVVTAGVAVASMAAGLRLVPQPAGGTPARNDLGPRPGIERDHLLGFLGVVLGAVSLLLIVLEGAPVLVLDACRYT
ncbi:MAG: hypothetical protein R2761_19055 [Acidimicrobiales bacterium]